MQKLFDENGLLNVAEIVLNDPTYLKIMDDGIVSELELTQQAETTITSLKKLQALCNEEQQNEILKAITDLSILFAVYKKYELQNYRI